ncbi:hypothetical protein AB1Y20_017514 [Prymnesium parvum]|uniref:Uncharacterized protein n=1 Tax=Prymnesium parvum TaxID=97485 RepID=A0AB34JNM5_PRYPA
MALAAAMLEEIESMMAPSGFDYVVVCCSNLSAETFWQARLEKTLGEVTGFAGKVVCVHEDWNGGAGNGLGTLYAFQKACAKSGVDLTKAMFDGASVAIYHTAGKGTRMAPLPGAENNNKPGVKLPGLLTVEGEHVPITVLESVMRQTSAYAKLRPGRCSVFWGDQVFVPSVGTKGSTAPADILAALRPMPTKEQWEEEQLHQYGLIAVDSKGGATQLEKVTYDVAVRYLPEDVVQERQGPPPPHSIPLLPEHRTSLLLAPQVGTSLGSFSLSAKLTEALLAEFAPELKEKKISLDSDPHFWMPLTLKESDYVAVMGKKGTPQDEALAHYKRMSDFKVRLGVQDVLGCVDVGQQAYWWDYGRLELYMTNNLFITEESPSAHALRTFMKLGAARQAHNSLGEGVTVDPSAVVLNCTIGKGRIGPNSVLVNVHAPSVDVEGCVIMQTTSVSEIIGKGGLLYNVVNNAGTLACDAVRADVFMPGGTQLEMKSSLAIDGGKVWKEKLDMNALSFEDVYKQNQALDVSECTQEAARAHAAARAKMAAA